MIGLLECDEVLARRADGFGKAIVGELRFLTGRADARSDLP
jgi:hypothetical protein